jgi:very-short-patch-repair endonuclease
MVLDDQLYVQVSKTIARQRGLITLHQLHAIGFDANGINRLVRRGVIVNLARGIFRSPLAPEPWEQLALAACMMNPAPAVLSHFTAARVWGLAAPTRPGVEITVTRARHPNTVGQRVTVHRTRHLPPVDRSHSKSLRVASVARTIADITPHLTGSALEHVLDDAISRRLLTPGGLVELLTRPEWRTRPGRHALELALGPWLAGPLLDSPPEAEAARLLQEAGLTGFVQHYQVFDGDKLVAELDFAIPSIRLAIEIDGYRYHSSPRAFAHDSIRQRTLESWGWFFVRPTPTEIRDSPETFVAAVRAQLARLAPHILAG